MEPRTVFALAAIACVLALVIGYSILSGLRYIGDCLAAGGTELVKVRQELEALRMQRGAWRREDYEAERQRRAAQMLPPPVLNNAGLSPEATKPLNRIPRPRT